MGILNSILGVAAPLVGNWLAPGIGGMLGSALGGAIAGGGSGGSSQSGTQTVTNKGEMDPRVAAMLFGDGTKRLRDGVTPTWTPGQPDANGQTWDTASNPESDYVQNTGMLGQYQSMLGQPQNAGAKIFGQAGDNYVGKFGAYDMEQQRDAANKLMAGNTATPTMGAASATAAQVNAPSQNGMDLRGSYDSLISGPAGANPYLTGAIGKGINQSTNAFGNMVTDAKQATQDVLGGIRSNSVLAGQYGGSRQGLAEGKAIESMNTQLGRAASQFGQNNTDAAVAAQAGAYDSDRNRQLAATQGLGAQQYGVASQNASMQQQTNQANAAFQQGANQNNQQAQMATNSLNSSNTQAGINGLGGILGNAAGQAQNQDAYALNQAGKVNSLLAPYLGQVPGSSTSSQPLYENRAGNILGGAAAGMSLYNQFNKTGMFNGSGSNPITSYNYNSGGNDGWTLPNGQSLGT